MQQPKTSGGILAGMFGIFGDNGLTSQKIINALKEDIKMGFLRSWSNEFIQDIIIPTLEITRDEPKHMAKILKAILNIIYLHCYPDSQYVDTWYYTVDTDKPSIPVYPNVEILRANWNKRYKEWSDLAKPYEINGIHHMPSKNTDFKSFEDLLLSALPEDETIFFPNTKVLTHLQSLVRQYHILEGQSVVDTANNRELKVLAPYYKG